MGLFDNSFFNSKFFSNRYMFWVHLLQIALILAVMGGSGARLLFLKVPGAPRSRANTMSLGMGAKSLIIIAYEILSSHWSKMHKWHSFKAIMILNCLEIVFWGAVAALGVQANLKFCVGTNCIVSWVVIAVAIVINIIAQWVAVVSINDYRYWKANGVARGPEVVLHNIEDGNLDKSNTESSDMHSMQTESRVVYPKSAYHHTSR